MQLRKLFNIKGVVELNKHFNVMSVNLYQLDPIFDYDLAIVALDGFIAELIIEFIDSIEGKAYFKAHPNVTEIGSWIDRLLYFGYVCESVTLPNMTTSNVEAIVTQIFPQQISQLNPTEANTTVPELKAFWQFLQREYKHSQASETIEFLEQLQPQFADTINDIQINLVTLPMSQMTELKTIANEDIQEFIEGDRDFSLQCVFDNLTSEGASLSEAEQIELETTLQELATEIISEFPQEVPSARELRLLLQQSPECLGYLKD